MSLLAWRVDVGVAELGHFLHDVDGHSMVMAPNYQIANCDVAFVWHVLRFDVANRCDLDGSKN